MKKLLALALAAAAASCQAGLLVQWDFATSLAGTIVSSSVASVDDISTNIAVGSRQTSGTLVNLPAGPGGGSGLDTVLPYAAGTASLPFYQANTFLTSPDTDRYISARFTMGSTIAPADALLDSIAFDLANGGASGPRGVEVTYRVGTSGSFTSLGITAVPNNSAGNYGRFTFSLAAPATLSPGDVVEVRLLGYSNALGNNIRLDNIAVTAIPEPSVYAAVLGAAAAAVLFLRRRRS